MLDGVGFATYEDLYQQVFYEGFEEDGFLAYTLVPSREGWEDYHIDLAFNLGEWNIDSTPTDLVDVNGVFVNIVSFLGIIIMKANI